ncbi:MAG TPA: glycoside hydrolase family 78 protein [Bryobacteraceae bacterium]|nr:glycoside hydrolase family 78 protein [Bryobacteraceae bacterium]
MKMLVLLLLPMVGALAAAIHPQQLRTEYRDDPQGVDVRSPRLSWLLIPDQANVRGLRQTAYRVLAASSEKALAAGTGDLWDSGRVESDESTQVPYAGKPLSSGQQVWWKVQVWDQDHKASRWSARARWSMGLLRAEDWQGNWIGREEAEGYQDPASPYQILKGAQWIWDRGDREGVESRLFRATFTVPQGSSIVHAWCIVGADHDAEVQVNGSETAFRSDATAPNVVRVESLLHPGENTIAVHANQTRANHPSGLIGALRVEFSSGNPLVVQTGSRWQASVDGNTWAPAVELGPYGMAPWGAAGLTGEHRLAGRYLRKEFAIDKKVRRAVVYYSGLGLSELYLNGARVNDHVLSPGLTDYDKHVLYVTEDVTGRLAAGRNAMGIALGNGRYYAPRADGRTRNFGYPRALVQLNIEYEDGTHASVVSDASWKLTTAGPIRADNEYDGEEYDARMELPGWNKAGFDDAQWEAVQLVAAPAGAIVSEMAEPLRVVETRKAASVKEIKPGTWIFDMGQNMVGWCRLHVAGPQGSTVRLRFAETLKDDGSLYVDNLRGARATDEYTLKGGGAETWEPRFTYHGFRYVEATGYPGTPTTAALEGRVVQDDMRAIADFRSSNELLNQIHHNVFWGIRSNYRSIPTDCPQRDERQGWLGDRSQVSRSESYMFDVAAFYSKWARDLVDSQRPDGSIPDVSPNYWPLYNDDVTWPSTLIFVPGMLYDQYGDKRVLEAAYPAMRRWLARERTFVTDGIISKDQYADWCVPPEDPKLIHSQDPARVTSGTLIATAFYYDLLRKVASYARILAKPAQAADLETEATTVNQAFQKRFYKPASSVYDNATQTSSILPLYFSMAPAEARPGLVASLARNIEEVTDGHVGTGLIGAQFLMRTLSDNGRSDLAYEIATQKTYPGWGYMVSKGATTIWELWNGDTADPAMNSGNHVMQIGDLAVWMYEYLGGIRSDPEHPGFKHILVHPYRAGNLTFVEASHRSPYGEIATSWKRGGGSFSLDVTVPPNTTASVWIPTKDAAAVTESGGAAANAPGVKFVRPANGGALFEVESGSYRFKATE